MAKDKGKKKEKVVETTPKTIRSCDCTSYRGNPQSANYQNEKYGLGLRVHTMAEKKYTCTVCGKETTR